MAPREVQWGRQGSSLGQQAVLALLSSKLKGLEISILCWEHLFFLSAGETHAEDPCGSGEGADINGSELQEE